MMATAYLFCGKIASGKTHFAEKWKQEKPAVLLSCDDLFLALFDDCLGPNHQDTERRAFGFFYKQARQLLEMGLDVLLDFGFWTKESRDVAKAYFIDRGLHVVLYYFDPPDETRISRLLERNQALSVSSRSWEYIIDLERLTLLDQKFETPDEREYTLRLTDV